MCVPGAGDSGTRPSRRQRPRRARWRAAPAQTAPAPAACPAPARRALSVSRRPANLAQQRITRMPAALSISNHTREGHASTCGALAKEVAPWYSDTVACGGHIRGLWHRRPHPAHVWRSVVGICSGGGGRDRRRLRGGVVLAGVRGRAGGLVGRQHGDHVGRRSVRQHRHAAIGHVRCGGKDPLFRGDFRRSRRWRWQFLHRSTSSSPAVHAIIAGPCVSLLDMIKMREFLHGSHALACAVCSYRPRCTALHAHLAVCCRHRIRRRLRQRRL